MQTTSFEFPIAPFASFEDVSPVSEELVVSSTVDARQRSVLPILLPILFGAVAAWGLFALNEATSYFVLNYQIQPVLSWFSDNGVTVLNSAAILATVFAISSFISERRGRQD